MSLATFTRHYNAEENDLVRQHDRYAQKLREAEIEAEGNQETFTQSQINEAMQRIFETL
jgi:hypothetical protein